MKNIKDKIMNKRIYYALTALKAGNWTIEQAHDEILSLMGENEIGVSDAPERKHGALHDVRESHASDLSDTDGEHTNGATLEEITSDENICSCDWEIPRGGYGEGDGYCGYCGKRYE